MCPFTDAILPPPPPLLFPFPRLNHSYRSIFALAAAFVLYHSAAEFVLVLGKAELAKHLDQIACEQSHFALGSSRPISRVGGSASVVEADVLIDVRCSSLSVGSSAPLSVSSSAPSDAVVVAADALATSPKHFQLQRRLRKTLIGATFCLVFVMSWAAQFALTKALPSSKFETHQKFVYYAVVLMAALACSILCLGSCRVHLPSSSRQTQWPAPGMPAGSIASSGGDDDDSGSGTEPLLRKCGEQNTADSADSR
jgi:hypothetical protein